MPSRHISTVVVKMVVLLSHEKFRHVLSAHTAPVDYVPLEEGSISQLWETCKDTAVSIFNQPLLCSLETWPAIISSWWCEKDFSKGVFKWRGTTGYENTIDKRARRLWNQLVALVWKRWHSVYYFIALSMEMIFRLSSYTIVITKSK